jgi:hypothetical protein
VIGGPGGSGTDFVLGSGVALSQYSGGQYDIRAFTFSSCCLCAPTHILFLYNWDTLLSHCKTPTNNQRDIVGWDPRGVGNTHPYIGCFNSTEEEAAFWQGTIPYTGIEAKGNFTNSDETDPDAQAFWQQEPEVDKLLGELGQICLRKNGDTLLYVGTAAVSIHFLSVGAGHHGERLPHRINFGATFAPTRRVSD